MIVNGTRSRSQNIASAAVSNIVANHRLFRGGTIDDLQGFPEDCQFQEAKEDVDDAKPGYGAAHEVIQDKISKRKRVGQEYVRFPECGPRHEDKEKPNLKTKENKGDGEETVHK